MSNINQLPVTTNTASTYFLVTSNGIANRFNFNNLATALQIQGAQGLRGSTGTNGFQSLAGGVIMQWGTSLPVAASGGSTSTLFTETFPNACYNIQITPNFSSTAGGNTYATNATTTGFTISNNSNATGTFYWVAIGR